MFSTLLASMSLTAALQVTAITEFGQHETPKPRRNPAVATSHAPIGVVDRAVDARMDGPPTWGSLDRARVLMTTGEFDLARREFRAAADNAHQAGVLPVEALRGLTVVLYAQGYTIEAAWTMEELARTALLRGDRETEALALADAIWLYVDGDQKQPATKLHAQLCAIVAETPLSASTIKIIHDRVRGVRAHAKGVAVRPAPAFK
jgi:hypothetical protein